MQPFKVCPQCQTPAQLDAPMCARCGRHYRTQFVPPQAAVINEKGQSSTSRLILAVFLALLGCAAVVYAYSKYEDYQFWKRNEAAMAAMKSMMATPPVYGEDSKQSYGDESQKDRKAAPYKP